MENKHWFPVTGLLEYFRSHVARCTASSREDVKRLFVHYPRKAKVCYQQICVIFRRPEEQVLWFQVAVYYAMIMEIGDSGESCADEVCSVGFVVASFSTYAIEQFPAEREVGYKIYCWDVSETSGSIHRKYLR